MRVSRIASGLGLLLATIALASPLRAQATANQQPSAPPREGLPAVAGMPAPDFIAEAIDGKRVSLAEFRGRLVLLVFWSTG